MSGDTSSLGVADNPPASSELIYEVTLEVPQRTIGHLDRWLRPHLRDMLTLPGFLAAHVVAEDQVPSGSGADRLRRVIRYRLTDYQALRRYLHQHAARVCAAGARRFGSELQASRRLLDAEGRELLTNSALSSSSAHCLNCGAALSGEYCSACGQPHHEAAAPLREVAGEFFGEHFGLDTKLIRSAVPLLFRPGFLSREYSAGRRVRYISPLRLYVFCSLLFFFVAWGSAPRQFFQYNGHEVTTPAASTGKPLSAAEQQEIRATPYLSAQQKRAILGAATGAVAGDTRDSRATAPVSKPDNVNVNLTLFGRHINMPTSEFQNRVTTALEHDLPKLMFVFLPLVALLLTLFYWRARRYYVEHLAFTLHTHAFIFVAMLAVLLADLVARHAGWAAAPAHYFKVLAGWYMVVYVFLAMLFYYRQSFLRTLGKYLLIGGIYWVCLFSVFMLGLVWVFTSVAD